MSDLIKAPPRALAPVQSVREAKAQVERARARLADRIDALEASLKPVTRLKQVFHRHPLLCLGGAFLVGYALARLTSPAPERKSR